jgi:2-polyprenyl-3-methyl-5-hydroxy-6-metoxy-1,4-benzoquinol methylase
VRKGKMEKLPTNEEVENNEEQLADERAYMYDDLELGIEATDKENKHWDRWRKRYITCANLTDKEGGKWLDVACGSGYGTEILSNYAEQAIGVDIDKKTIEYANKFHKKKDNVNFLCQDIRKLALNEEEKFDAIISIETIEHISDANPFLKSIVKLLSENGVFVVTTPESLCGGGPNPDNKYHVNEYTIEQFKTLLENYFEKVEITTEKAIFTTGIETVQVYAICTGQKNC